MGIIIMQIVYYAFKIYGWLIIANILMSWIPGLSESKIGRWINSIVEPYLSIFRKFIPTIGMIDFSPIIALFVYRLLGELALVGLSNLLAMI